MTTRSYVNDVKLQEVSIAIERLLIAEYPNVWTPGVGRVDLTPGSLPTGFRDLGAVVEDSVNFQITRQVYTLSTGIPAIRQYEKVIGMEGTLEVALHSTSWRKLQYALGNITAVSSATLMSSILSVTNASVITLSTAPTSACTIGDTLVICTTPNVDAVDTNETVLRSVVTVGASTTTWYCTPPLPVTPTTSFQAYRYDRVDSYYGIATQREFSLLGVADFLDGWQIVHEFPRCKVAGDFSRQIQPGENLRLPITFNAFAVKRTIRGNEELILAQESYFPERGSA